MSITELIQNAFYSLGIIGIFFTVYIYFRGPQESSKTTEKLLGERLATLGTELANLRDNHVHSLDLKLDITNKAVQDLALQLTRLNTIIEERIPRK